MSRMWNPNNITKATQVCYYCRITRREVAFLKSERSLCQHCRQPMVSLSTKIRVPKKSASNRKWNQFWEWLRNMNPYFANQIPR